jgi:putative ABC transport system ATP-binding protein
MNALAHRAAWEALAPPATTRPLAVELRDVVKSHGEGVAERMVLRGIGLEVQEGRFVALEGGSGSGKTTLLGLIAGFDRPTGGRITVVGTDIGGLSEDGLARWRRGTVGVVMSRRPDLLPLLDVADNVALALLPMPLPTRERRARAQAALESVGLAGQAARRPRDLSMEEAQRAMIARAIVARPRLLLADEPTRALEGPAAAAVLDLLERSSRQLGATLLIATGDPAVAARADLRQRLQDGRMTAAGGLR